MRWLVLIAAISVPPVFCKQVWGTGLHELAGLAVAGFLAFIILGQEWNDED